MKKIISVILACIMLSALFVMPTSAAQSNVDVSALKFTKQPTIDGVISEEEWGAMTFSVKGSEASTNSDESVNEFNTYIEFQDEEVREYFGYDVWLRWDADYFYIGAIVHDPDGHSLPQGGASIWNGDVIQFRIDPSGPNSCMKRADPNYDYKTTAFDFNKYIFKDDTSRIWVNASKLINAGIGLVNKTSAQAFDMQAEKDMTLDGTLVGITTVDTGDMVDTFYCETVYECAIPWATIGATGAENTLLGMTMVGFNSVAGSYNAYLTWGSGLCGSQSRDARKTAGGSNAVTLVADEVTPADTYAVVTTEVETVPDFIITEKADDGASTTKAPETTTPKVDNPNDFDDVQNEGFPVWAIVLIVVAVVAVVAVVVIVIVKKKKKAE